MTTDEDEVVALVAGARTFPDNMLIGMLVDTMDRAVAINNSGLFKVAGILIDEIDRRGLGDAAMRDYRRLIATAVTEAESRR